MDATEHFLAKVGPVLDFVLKNQVHSKFTILAGPGEVPSRVVGAYPHESYERYLRRVVDLFFEEGREELAVCLLQREYVPYAGSRDTLHMDTLADGEYVANVCSITSEGYTFLRRPDSQQLSDLRGEIVRRLGKMD